MTSANTRSTRRKFLATIALANKVARIAWAMMVEGERYEYGAVTISRVVPFMDEVFGQAINEMFGQPFELLLGRKTYEIFAAHWPYAEGGDDDFIAKRFNSITKYVATRSSMELTWKGSVALRDATADVARLKREDGPALVTQGSSNLIQTLLANDLIDEISTFTFPIVLGNGKKLFGEGARSAAFTLVESECRRAETD